MILACQPVEKSRQLGTHYNALPILASTMVEAVEIGAAKVWLAIIVVEVGLFSTMTTGFSPVGRLTPSDGLGPEQRIKSTIWLAFWFGIICVARCSKESV